MHVFLFYVMFDSLCPYFYRHLRKFPRRNWSTVPITLDELTTLIVKELLLFNCFHTFRHYRFTQAMRPGNDCLDNTRVFGIRNDITYQGAINFQNTNRKAFKLAK